MAKNLPHFERQKPTDSRSLANIKQEKCEEIHSQTHDPKWLKVRDKEIFQKKARKK